MSTIKRFEDIAAWQAARVLIKGTYAATQRGAFARDRGLRDQMQRASVSVMSNIAEGYERGSAREFRHFLFIAKASAGEVRSLLYVAHDLGYISQDVHCALAQQAASISRQIANFISYLDRKA